MLLILWLAGTIITTWRNAFPRKHFTNLHVHKNNVIKLTILQTCLDQNRKTAYDLIASHGDVENLIFFAMLMQGVYL